MKKTFIITCLLAIGNGCMYSQNLKDFKNKLSGQPASTNSTTTTTETPTGGSQYIMAESFFNAGTSFSTCRFTSSTGAPYQESAKITRDLFFQNIKKDENNNIIEFKNKLGNGTFKPNEAAFPMYYFCKDGGLTPYIYFIDGFAICTKDAFTSPEQLDKTGCSPWEIYCVDKSKLKGLDCDKVKAMLKAHVGAAKVGVDAERAKEKETAEKLEAEKRAKYTTQGREVTKIRVECSSKTMQQGKSYSYVVIATLKDGTEISTANGGYIDEYEVIASGLPSSYTDIYGTKYNTLNGTNISVPMEAAVSGDKVTLNIKSKYHKTLSTTISFEMVYSDNIILDYNGDIDAYGNYRNGGDFRVEIKLVKHSVNSENLIEYKVFSKTTGNLLKHFKINQSSSVNFLVNGKTGKSAGQKNPANNGTNGGNVTIVIDPSVKSYNLNITNSGGAGGKGNSSYPSNGNAGSNGKIEKINQEVTW